MLWRRGTMVLWVEVREPDGKVLAIPVQPERALDAFHHPYAYAGPHRPPFPWAETTGGRKDDREQ